MGPEIGTCIGIDASVVWMSSSENYSGELDWTKSATIARARRSATVEHRRRRNWTNTGRNNGNWHGDGCLTSGRSSGRLGAVAGWPGTRARVSGGG
jgi:hypothetical protein